MTTDRNLLSQLVDLTVGRVRHAAWMPRLATGTVTAEGIQPTVELDAGTASGAAATPCRMFGDPPGLGERVLVIQAAGTSWVAGRLAGSTRLYGWSSATSNQTGITTETALTDLSVDVVVNQPGRLLRVDGQIQTVATDSGGQVTGRIQQDAVTIGRYGRYTAAVASDTRLMSGHCLVEDPDPGGYTFRLTLECTTAGSVSASNATVDGLIEVWDIGNANPNQ